MSSKHTKNIKNLNIYKSYQEKLYDLLGLKLGVDLQIVENKFTEYLNSSKITVNNKSLAKEYSELTGNYRLSKYYEISDNNKQHYNVAQFFLRLSRIEIVQFPDTYELNIVYKSKKSKNKLFINLFLNIITYYYCISIKSKWFTTSIY